MFIYLFIFVLFDVFFCDDNFKNEGKNLDVKKYKKDEVVVLKKRAFTREYKYSEEKDLLEKKIKPNFDFNSIASFISKSGKNKFEEKIDLFCGSSKNDCFEFDEIEKDFSHPKEWENENDIFENLIDYDDNKSLEKRPFISIKNMDVLLKDNVNRFNCFKNVLMKFYEITNEKIGTAFFFDELLIKKIYNFIDFFNLKVGKFNDSNNNDLSFLIVLEKEFFNFFDEGYKRLSINCKKSKKCFEAFDNLYKILNLFYCVFDKKNLFYLNGYQYKFIYDLSYLNYQERPTVHISKITLDFFGDVSGTELSILKFNNNPLVPFLDEKNKYYDYACLNFGFVINSVSLEKYWKRRPFVL